MQVKCWLGQGPDCLSKLLRATCAAGRDTLYGFDERAQSDSMKIAAVVAYGPAPPSAFRAPASSRPTAVIAP